MTEDRKQKRERLKTAREREQYRTSQYGTLGPASPVRRIDPKTGKVIEVIEAKGDRRKP